MRQFLSSIPIWIVLADMVYGFTLNVTQSLNSRHSAPSSSDGLPLTPDIAFNSLQTLSNGGMILIIGFGLVVLLQLNRTVLKKQILPIGVFRTLGLLAVLAFSIPSLWEWFWALIRLTGGESVLNFSNIRYLITSICLPLIALTCIFRLFGWSRLHKTLPNEIGNNIEDTEIQRL